MAPTSPGTHSLPFLPRELVRRSWTSFTLGAFAVYLSTAVAGSITSLFSRASYRLGEPSSHTDVAVLMVLLTVLMAAIQAALILAFVRSVPYRWRLSSSRLERRGRLWGTLSVPWHDLEQVVASSGRQPSSRRIHLYFAGLSRSPLTIHVEHLHDTTRLLDHLRQTIDATPRLMPTDSRPDFDHMLVHAKLPTLRADAPLPSVKADVRPTSPSPRASLGPAPQRVPRSRRMAVLAFLMGFVPTGVATNAIVSEGWSGNSNQLSMLTVSALAWAAVAVVILRGQPFSASDDVFVHHRFLQGDVTHPWSALNRITIDPKREGALLLHWSDGASSSVLLTAEPVFTLMVGFLDDLIATRPDVVDDYTLRAIDKIFGPHRHRKAAALRPEQPAPTA